MRHQYTPVFREFTTSSMWAESPEVRCVWLWLMLHADPEGFVPGTIPGLAVAANVDITSTRSAVDKFMAPDPDSNTPDNEGRRLEKVPHGWRILNFEYWRELAKKEAEKARKRRWVAQKRGKQLQLPFPPEFLPSDDDPDHFVGDVDTASPCVDSSENLDAPKPKPKPKPLSSEGEDPPSPPVIRVRPVVKDLDGWEPSDELRADATIAGVERLDDRIASLRSGPIGGQRGVFKDDIDNYIRGFFGQWRTWEETDRAKDAQRSAAVASPRRFGGAAPPPDPFEASAHQEAFAARHGLDLSALLKGVLDDYPQPSPSLSRRDVLGERLTVACKQKRAGQAVTGKLTREQAATWGPVPPGGAIPEVA